MSPVTERANALTKLFLSGGAGYILTSFLFPERGWASSTKKKPEKAEIYSKTGVRKRIDPKLAHQIQGALNDLINNCVCQESVFTGLNCPMIGLPCTHWDKEIAHKTQPLRPPNAAEMQPWTRLSIA
jgi:hypothetical protein